MMKKIFAFILILSLLSMIFSCDQSAVDEGAGSSSQTVDSIDSGNPDETRALSYEEILALETVHASEPDRPSYDNLNEFIQYNLDRDIPFSLVTGRVLEVHYYLIWNQENDDLSARTCYSIEITGLDASQNTIGAQVGDVLNFVQFFGVMPKDPEVRLELMAEQYASLKGVSVQSIQSLQDMENVCCEVVPTQGVEYHKIVYGNDLPLKAGDSYTFSVSDFGYEVNGTHCYYGWLNQGIGTESVSEMAKQYQLYFDPDVLELTDELAQRMLKVTTDLAE